MALKLLNDIFILVSLCSVETYLELEEHATYFRNVSVRIIYVVSNIYFISYVILI